MTVKDELIELVNDLDDKGAADVLDYVRWLLVEEEDLTPEEWAEVRLGKKQIARRESIMLDELLRELGD